jgi:hypothetical protein
MWHQVELPNVNDLLDRRDVANWWLICRFFVFTNPRLRSLGSSVRCILDGWVREWGGMIISSLAPAIEYKINDDLSDLPWFFLVGKQRCGACLRNGIG